jgi:hypothetical protein
MRRKPSTVTKSPLTVDSPGMHSVPLVPSGHQGVKYCLPGTLVRNSLPKDIMVGLPEPQIPGTQIESKYSAEITLFAQTV